jgi:hypothetical protein
MPSKSVELALECQRLSEGCLYTSTSLFIWLRKADLEYLRILHLAASTLESEVEAALALLLEAEQGISLERVKALVESQVRADWA